MYMLEWGTGFGGDNADSQLVRIDYNQDLRPPSPSASADRDSGPMPLAVQFSSAGTDPGDRGPLTYAWDFDGNGTTDSDRRRTRPSPTTSPGNFTARLDRHRHRRRDVARRASPSPPATRGRTVTLTLAAGRQLLHLGPAPALLGQRQRRRGRLDRRRHHPRSAASPSSRFSATTRTATRCWSTPGRRARSPPRRATAAAERQHLPRWSRPATPTRRRRRRCAADRPRHRHAPAPPQAGGALLVLLAA